MPLRILMLCFVLSLGLVYPSPTPVAAPARDMMMDTFSGKGVPYSKEAHGQGMPRGFGALQEMAPYAVGTLEPKEVLAYFSARFADAPTGDFLPDDALETPAQAEEYLLPVKTPVAQYMNTMAELPEGAMYLYDLYNFDEGPLRWSLYILSDLEAAWRLLICREAPGEIVLLVVDMPPEASS